MGGAARRLGLGPRPVVLLVACPIDWPSWIASSVSAIYSGVCFR